MAMMKVMLMVIESAMVIALEKVVVIQLMHTSHLTPHTSHLAPHTSHLTPHTVASHKIKAAAALANGAKFCFSSFRSCEIAAK